MIDWLVNKLFWWTPLRNALIAEVHMYDEISKRLDEDIYSPEHNSLFWNDGDGWRSRSFSIGRQKYYFNDIPDQSLAEAMRYSFESLGPEFDLDEVW